MEPVGVATQSTQGIQTTISTTPAVSATLPLLHMPMGPIPVRTMHPERCAPIPMDQYQWVNRATGIRHTLAISQARLPMLPGPTALAFQKLQGSSQNPTELTRQIWLLYHSQSHLDVWKEAVAAACEACQKVILLPTLLLLLELANLPWNKWENISDLWATSSKLLSLILPGIHHNLDGFAGLDNYDINTANLIGMWTSGSLKCISAASGQQKDCSDVKSTFHIALTSPNLWQIPSENCLPGVLLPNLRRLCYNGLLEPDPIVLWLQMRWA